MLVLSRRIGERIMVGPDIIVTLIHMDRSKARIGISAPKGTEIWREELLRPDGTLPPVRHRPLPPDDPDPGDVGGPFGEPDIGGEGGEGGGA